MIDKLIYYLSQYSNIGILGFGKEGKAFCNFLLKHLPKHKIIIYDQNQIRLDKQNITIYSGDNYLDYLKYSDLIIKSPGISLCNIGINYQDYNFTSSTELFVRFFSSQIIGVTGTKGKSTTATFLYKLLQNNGTKTILLGNIGEVIFENIENISSDMVVVLELSSHQLYNIKY